MNSLRHEMARLIEWPPNAPKMHALHDLVADHIKTLVDELHAEVERVSELEAVVERVGLLLAESRITPAGRQPIPAGDLHDALKGPQDAQEAAQGDDRGEVGSECADDVNGAQAGSQGCGWDGSEDAAYQCSCGDDNEETS